MSGPTVRARILLAAMVLAMAAGVGRAGDDARLAARVLEMTGARTKIVWAHHVAGSGGQWGGGRAEFELMAFDTTPPHRRRLLPGPASYGNPSITPDGRRVVFTDVPELKIYSVDWKGGQKKLLTEGFALCAWKDPKTRKIWVYAGQAEFNAPIFRFQLDEPSVREVVWEKPASCTNGFGVSADGTRAGSMFPWPSAGVAILPNVSWSQYGHGCEGCLAPDNSYRFFHMGEAAGHSGVMMYDAGGSGKRVIRFNNFPNRGRQDSWNARWTTDVRFLTVSSPNSGPRQEVYLGEFDERFTRVTRWIQITDRPRQDLVSHAWINPGLGVRSGEAPLTVEIPAPEPGGGPWEWDYGDGGAKAKAPGGKHTYARGGRFTVTARRGEKLVKGHVSVRPRKAPAVTAAGLLDEVRLLVRIDEPVVLREAKVTLASGTPITRMALDETAQKLVLHLGGRLGASDTLRWQGIYDLAQVPNRLAEPVALRRPTWPSVRSDLVLLWERDTGERFHDRSGKKEFVETALKPWRQARTDRHGAMELRGGVYVADGAGSGIAAQVTRTSQFSLQATLRPDNLHQGHRRAPARIVSSQWGSGIRDVNFALAQESEKLLLYLYNRPAGKRTQPAVWRVELCDLKARAPNHITVSYAWGNLTCYRDGKLVKQTDEIKGMLPWRKVSAAGGLTVGGVPGSRFPWRGKVEGIAIFARALTAEQAADDFAAYAKRLAARKKVPRVVFRGKLLAKSKAPEPADIAPYVDALTVNEFQVLAVLSGQYAPKRIRVAQWGMLNQERTPFARAPIGATVELAVEPFNENPQLEAQLTRDTLPEDFDLDRYVDVTIRPSGEPRLLRVVLRPAEVWAPRGHRVQFDPELLDQYGNPFYAKLLWTVAGKGGIDAAAAEKAGRWFREAHQPGKGTIDNGRFVGAADGTVTVTAAEAAHPEVRASAIVGVGPYPGVSPAAGLPLRFGADNDGKGGFIGDIDRIRLYRRELQPEEVAAHAAGEGLEAKDPLLVGDWTFDERAGGVYPNAAGKGLDAKPVGEVEHVRDRSGAYVRLFVNGRLDVASDKRLDISRSLSIETWVRPTIGGMLACRGRGPQQGFYLAVSGHGIRLDGLRPSWGLMQAQHQFDAKRWTHVVGILGSGGRWRLFVNGKLVKQYKAKPTVIRRSTAAKE